MSQVYRQRVACGLERMEAALEEVEELGLQGCWIYQMFKGPSEGSQYTWMECSKIKEYLSFQGYMEFQRGINYQQDQQAQFLSYFYYYVSQELYLDSYKTKGATYQQKYVVILVALAVYIDEGLQRWVQELTRRELLREKEYLEQLEQKYSKLVYGYEITNTIVVFNLVVKQCIEVRVSLLIER